MADGRVLLRRFFAEKISINISIHQEERL